MEQDPIKKEEKKARLMKETIPFYLSKFEKILSENNGFSVGNEVSDNFEIPPFSSLFCRLLRVCARTTATAHLPNKGNDWSTVGPFRPAFQPETLQIVCPQHIDAIFSPLNTGLLWAFQLWKFAAHKFAVPILLQRKLMWLVGCLKQGAAQQQSRSLN